MFSVCDLYSSNFIFVVVQEMLSRSSLETQKLELLSSVTELKRQLVALSRENAELRNLQQHRPPVAPRTFYPSQSQVIQSLFHFCIAIVISSVHLE